MNARQAKKANSKRIVSEKIRPIEKIKIKANFKVSKKGKRHIISVLSAPRTVMPDLGILQAGFERMGWDWTGGYTGKGGTGIANSIIENLNAIGNNTCDNIKGWEDKTWKEIVAEALLKLDEWDIKNSWIKSYFHVAPTYEDGEGDDVTRGAFPYITSSEYGLGVFRVWAEDLSFMEKKQVERPLIDL